MIKKTVNGREVNILVVDDIDLNLDVMEGLLGREGFTVLKAGNGQAGLDVLGKNRVDLAILDVMMPGMDGYELCRRIKSIHEPKFFPVILVTALNDIEDKIKGIEAGADDFISKPFHTAELTKKIRSLLKLKALQEDLEHSENIIISLALTIEAKDPYTKGHSSRVSELACDLSRELGLDEREVKLIRKAGLLHDIGKIGVSESVLHKGGRLTKQELEMVRRHPVIGVEICSPLESLKPMIPAIRHHHERWDGSGYPDGIAGEDIPLIARVLSVVDTFDAIVSDRPYRTPFDPAGAVEIINSELDTGQWDPHIAMKFIKLVRRGGNWNA